MRCRILMLSVAHGGYVMPWVGLASELARRGHQVSFTTTDQFAGAFAGAGQEVVPYTSCPPPVIKGDPGHYSKLWCLDESSSIMDAAKARFADNRPDVILYDMSAFYAGRILSHIWQLPAVMLSSNFASGLQYSLDADVVGKRLDNSYAPAMGDFLTTLGRFLSVHAPEVPMHAPLLFPFEELNVVALPRELQIAGDTFDERCVFTGPCLDERAFQGQWHPPGEDPVLLVSFGSSNYAGQQAFLETCVSAFTGLDWHVVLSTGPQLDPADLGPLPPNIEAHRHVPQLAILKNARLFISHAGMSGVLESLSQGVPILAFPQLAEHQITADRISDLGLGRSREPDISAEELRAAALDLAVDTATADSLTQMREHIRKAGGASRAAEEIELHMLQG